MLVLSHSYSPLLSANCPKSNSSPRRLLLTAAAAASPSQPPSPAAAAALAKSALRRISEKLRKLGYIDPASPARIGEDCTSSSSSSAAGEIFLPIPHEIPVHRVGSTLDPSWSTPEHPVPIPGAQPSTVSRFSSLYRREKAAELRAARARKRNGGGDKDAVPTAAELMLPAEELRRLRTLGIRVDRKLKVGKAGVTEGIVNAIHERWRNSEIVKICCEDLCRMNMKRTHEILERKTGGLVVWRAGSVIILYRGANYQYPYFHVNGKDVESKYKLGPVSSDCAENAGSNEELTKSNTGSPIDSPSWSFKRSLPVLVSGVGSPTKVRFQLPGEAKLAEEANKLLEGLGPRFNDWWGCDPYPVDADLLPAIIPGFRKPFRLLPFGIKPILTDREMTILRRLGRPVPCHFVLGRNKGLQGLAASIIKLWERCEIAKIVVKRGVQNTRSELMAEELKHLTGGTVLSRDKDYIVLYRGKDFLPPAVSMAIEERRNHVNKTMDKSKEDNMESMAKGNLEIASAAGSSASKQDERRLSAAEKSKLSLQTVESRLNQAIAKKERAEKLLSEFEKTAESPKYEVDKEAISEEERYMLRRVGLRMKAFLLLGRRGVFDGTVENMHLHWKYRELVKVICREHRFEDIKKAARILEAESGGILVAVERTSKGHAIIVYRGKNYQRPCNLRPKSLLNKREAMKHSLEAQRCQSLKLHVLGLAKKINHLKAQMANNENGPRTNAMVTDDLNVQSLEAVDSPQFSCNDSTNDFNKPDFIGGQLDCGDPPNAVTQSKFVSEMENSDSSEVNDGSNASFSSTINASLPKQSSDLGEDAGSLENEVPNGSKLPVTKGEKDEYPDAELVFKAAPLSNRERLILRKQALKMRKRPVLAVGKNNVISGVARTIRTHFRKHPLAIVNIKARAEGTSVQQLVFELEEATGSVLVSTEPNKVILYRGWGMGEAAPYVKGGTACKPPGAADEVISPQLLEAIRYECGLQQLEGER